MSPACYGGVGYANLHSEFTRTDLSRAGLIVTLPAEDSRDVTFAAFNLLRSGGQIRRGVGERRLVGVMGWVDCVHCQTTPRSRAPLMI